MRRTFGGAKVRSNGAKYAVLRRLYGSFAAAADRAPVDFTELLLTPSVGARTVRALAMVAEVVHGAPYRFSDPADFRSHTVAGAGHFWASDPFEGAIGPTGRPLHPRQSLPFL